MGIPHRKYLLLKAAPLMSPFKPGALIVAALSLMALACKPAFFTGGRDIDAAITATAVRRIELGMKREQVVQILGFPKEERAEHLSTIDGEHHRVVLQYAQAVAGARWYPMLWVHLEAGSVVEVYAKRYIFWGADDVGVYSLSASRRWETTDRFEATFGK
jgi:hypothetical protein